MKPTGMQIATPMVAGVNEQITVKVKLLGPVREIRPRGDYNTKKPRLHGPFNLNDSRGILYRDHVLPEWTGSLLVDGGPDLDGPPALAFDGINQGVFPGDSRPIGVFNGGKWLKAGFHWIRLTDPASGLTALSNPVLVTAEKPKKRIYWGDPHWQTFFTDGIRCPEALYAFARDEAFLDFGALSDHTEGLTNRQWDYFTAVTNDYNAAGSFATLIGQEWTSMTCGHRNIYFRGDTGPILRSEDPEQDTLPKIWSILADHEAIAIPHHSASIAMGVDWDLGWNPKMEPAVEIHSIWGSSECSAAAGNPKPITVMGGEKPGQHVIDALKRGYRFGFVGGGDIHDGRPGDEMHTLQRTQDGTWRQGLTAVWTDRLTRGRVYDAIKARSTYATTCCRIYLNAKLDQAGMGQTVCWPDWRKKPKLTLDCASPEPLEEVVVIQNGLVVHTFKPDENPLCIQTDWFLQSAAPGDFVYIRVLTQAGNLAWSSPFWLQ